MKMIYTQKIKKKWKGSYKGKNILICFSGKNLRNVFSSSLLSFYVANLLRIMQRKRGRKKKLGQSTFESKVSELNKHEIRTRRQVGWG